MIKKKIIMLVGRSESSAFMYNALKNDVSVTLVVREQKVDKQAFVKRRIKKLGRLKVFGQLLFQISVPKLLGIASRKRIDQIKLLYKLDATAIPLAVVKEVKSVNSDECTELLKREKPDLVIVNGTRIISSKVLNCTNAVFINTHAGITPKYRGVHGGYWSIANADKDNFGVTVHIVDPGIDTGGVLSQKTVPINSSDNFSTYPYLQIGEGIQLMRTVVSDVISGALSEKEALTVDSKLWHHPTLWFYLKNRLVNGVK